MKKKINIYDFDKTIVPFDSGTLYIVYCMVHYPWCIITLPIILIGLILTCIKVISFTQFKATCFMFYPLVPKSSVKKFWDKYESKVHSWFKEREGYSVVISASPDFLLDDISQRLGFDELICTKHSSKSGRIIGENCRNEEKVRRLYELYKPEEIEVVDVYSDSYTHDKPIFSLATNQCYHIEDSKMVAFNFNDVYGEQA